MSRPTPSQLSLFDADQAVEQWRPAVGWEGFYEVSDQGRVRSVDRIVPAGPRTKNRRALGQIRAVFRHPRSGHIQLTLNASGKQARVKVHRLVLEAFVGPCPEGMQCCHWDDNPANNRVENLRWDTCSANMYDRVRNGRHPMARKTHCKNGHLYDEANTGIGRRGGRTYRWCRQCNRDIKNRIGAHCRKCAEGMPCDFQHGLSGHTYHGCRCATCKQAKSVRDHENYRRRCERAKRGDRYAA